jgi:hypothetical protein
MKKISLVAVAACAGLFGALAQAALSGDGKVEVTDRIAAKSRAPEKVSVRTVPGASASATKPYKTLSSAFVTSDRPLAPGQDDAVQLKCPRGHAVTGLFRTSAPGVFVGLNTTVSNTTVLVAVVNVATEPRSWRPGVRCLRR